MLHIKTLVEQCIREEDRWKITLLEQWSAIMGTLANRVTLQKIYDDTLVLGVYDASWLQELYLLSPILCKTINTHLASDQIKRLHFKQVAPTKRKLKKQQQHKTVYSRNQITFTNQEQEALEAINDKELQEGLKNFLIRCYKEQL